MFCTPQPAALNIDSYSAALPGMMTERKFQCVNVKTDVLALTVF